MYFAILATLSVSVLSYVQARTPQVTDDAMSLLEASFLALGGPVPNFEVVNPPVDNPPIIQRLPELVYEQANRGIFRCSLPPVTFVVPPLNTIRGPISVTFDLRNIFWALRRDEAEPVATNLRIQELLFERLLGDDSEAGTESLVAVDRALYETYELFYNPEAAPPMITNERKTQIDNIVRSLMTSRRHLVGVLYNEISYPNAAGLVQFNGVLAEAHELNIGRTTNIPEEKLLVDILRGLESILGRVVTYIRENPRRRQRVPFTTTSTRYNTSSYASRSTTISH